jgi:hypothetical protein
MVLWAELTYPTLVFIIIIIIIITIIIKDFLLSVL